LLVLFSLDLLCSLLLSLSACYLLCYLILVLFFLVAEVGLTLQSERYQHMYARAVGLLTLLCVVFPCNKSATLLSLRRCTSLVLLSQSSITLLNDGEFDTLSTWE